MEVVSEPEVVEVKKEDDAMTEVDSDSEMTMDECFEQLRLTKEPSPDVYEPPVKKRIISHVSPTRRVRYDPKPVRYPDNRYTYKGLRNQYLGQPSMPVPPRAPRKLKGRAKMRFRSHYGLNGEYMDTQSKAHLLLHSCFG